MDDVDLGILRELGLEPFVGGPRGPRPWRPEVLARRLRMNPRLMKDRLARLERERIIEAYDVFPNLALLGLAWRSWAFRYPARAHRRATLERLAEVQGVIAYVDYVTDWLTVTLAYRDHAEGQHRLGEVRKLLGGVAAEASFEPEAAPVGREPSRLDWRLIRALRGQANRPLHELARALGISARTVRRRLDRLAAAQAFDSFVRLHPRAMDELLLCSLVFRVEEARASGAMRAIHGELLADAWVHCSAPPLADGLHYDLVARPASPRSLAELLDAAARVPGVADVEAHVAAGISWVPAWVDAELDRRVG